MSNLIVGWGTTGKSISNFFEDNNMNDYKIWDDYITDTISEKIEDDPSNVTIDNYSKVYVSPGVPPNHQLILQSDNNLNKIPIETDLDIFFDINKDLALKVHKILNCRHYSRVDFLLDKNNDPWFLEINTLPGMTETSLLPKSLKASGIEFKDVIQKILNEAIKS